MTPVISVERFLLVLGLSFFFGLAFEEFYHASPVKPPGGIRTFPLLALFGMGLFLVAPGNGLALAVGALIVGAWQVAYYRSRLGKAPNGTGEPSASLIVPVCNLLAFALGPMTLVVPPWLSVAVAVSAVVLMNARQKLHEFASRIPGREIITLGQFLVLTGVILPLLPDTPVTRLTPITPYQAWLAVVTVSALSYGSYLAQRYLPLKNSPLATAFLGGLYSSTATTVVIARRLRAVATRDRDLQAGIVLATAVMYFRILAVIAIFNFALAKMLAPTMAALLIGGAALAVALARLPPQAPGSRSGPIATSSNPLELSTAVIFAVSFVAVSIAATWAKTALGHSGFLWLAGIVGFTDIDPFVLSVAQGSAAGMDTHTLVTAVLIAASSNNVLKALYAAIFSRARYTAIPCVALVILAVAGFAAAIWL